MNTSPEHSPPARAHRFLTFFLREDLQEEVLGDLEEKFYQRLEQSSLRQARRHYWYQVLHYLRPFAIKRFQSPNLNHYDMYRNYFKIGYRNLWRNKGFSLINIGGLSVGLAVTMLIGLWIKDELSFNQYHENFDTITQVRQHQTYNGATHTQEPLPFPIGETLREEYGDAFQYVVMSSWLNDHILSYEGKRLLKPGNYMERGAAHLLSLNMLAGTRDGLEEPGSILLSASAAKALFGEQDPIGKPMQIDNELSVQVTGIYEDIPKNNTFQDLHFIATWDQYVNSYDWVRREREQPTWDNNSHLCYAQIASNTSIPAVNKQIELLKYQKLREDQRFTDPKIFLHPMQDWHLRSRWKAGKQSGGLITYVWLFGVIGVFVLLLAGINFMNLSTAQAEKRAKEIGVRKSMGSRRGQLIHQFLTEALLVGGLAFILAIGLVLAALPGFNQLAEKQIDFPFFSPEFWLFSLLFLCITCLLAGSYPAFYLSGFDPVSILKGTLKANPAAGLFRKVLVVVQFTVSVVLIIGTIVVDRQIQHTKNRPLGYESDGVIMFEMTTSTDFEHRYNLLRDALISKGAVEEMTQSSSPLTAIYNTNGGFSWPGKDPSFRPEMATIWVTHDYGETVNWDLVEGRDFSRQITTDSSAYILNEAAVNYMGLEDPVGKVMRWGNGPEHPVIGVVKDMVMTSPYQAARPSIYMIDYLINANYLFFKLPREKSVQASIALIKEVFQEHVPAVPFEYEFADAVYAEKFSAEERIRKLSRIFAVLAIFISCLGLFGLASFMAAQRMREISIRKVLGATVLDLWTLLSKDFVLLVLLACLLAIPIAYFGLKGWLESFEYRTQLYWWFFVAASLGALVITLLTISFQSIKAATANPVDSL